MDKGKAASKSRRGYPTKGKAPCRAWRTARDAAKDKPPAASPGPGNGTQPWEEEACPWVGATASPSYHQSHLCHPTALRGPALARCGPPVGTEFIFLASCDNTWLCLFNFLLWMGQENQFGSLRSKHSSPHIMRGHPHRRSSLHQPRKHIWPTAGRGRPRGPRGGCSVQRGLGGFPHRPLWQGGGGISIPHRAQGPQGEWHRCGSRKQSSPPGPHPPELQEADQRTTGEDSIYRLQSPESASDPCKKQTPSSGKAYNTGSWGRRWGPLGGFTEPGKHPHAPCS